HAVLFHERALLHLGQHVETLQHPVGVRDQRLADMKAGKPFPFEQLDAVPVLRNQRRRGGPRRAAANHHDIRTTIHRSITPVLITKSRRSRRSRSILCTKRSSCPSCLRDEPSVEPVRHAGSLITKRRAFISNLGSAPGGTTWTGTLSPSASRRSRLTR